MLIDMCVLFNFCVSAFIYNVYLLVSQSDQWWITFSKTFMTLTLEAVPWHFQEDYSPTKRLGQKVCGASKGAGGQRYCFPCQFLLSAINRLRADLSTACRYWYCFPSVLCELWHTLGMRIPLQCTGENIILKLPSKNTRKAKDYMTQKPCDLGCDATWIAAAVKSNAFVNAIRKQLWTLWHKALFSL